MTAYALLLILAVTAASYVWILARYGERWSPGLLRSRAGQILRLRSDHNPPGRQPIEVVHPYLGYVLNPDSDEEGWRLAGWSRPIINRFGFEGVPEPLPTTDGDGIRIAVVGGSVAKSLCNNAREHILQAFREAGETRRIELVCLALGGYKQPQQFLSVAYFLALGARFDAVVNLDGFNEVALFPAENRFQGVCPSFPRVWYGRSELYPDRTRLSLLGAIEFLEQRRARVASRLATSKARLHPLTYLLWRGYDRHLARTIDESRTALRRHAPSELPGLNAGVVLGEDLWRSLGMVWLRGSLQLHGLCAANGIHYFHFLQPNQYVAGSKPMGPEEYAVAFDPAHPYREGVEHGYPVLRRLGHDLLGSGVSFTDLSQIFAGCEEALYLDTCCHLNDRGNARLAAAIVSHVAPSLVTASV